jgi:excalibur calcium-binding domain-containing protein
LLVRLSLCRHFASASPSCATCKDAAKDGRYNTPQNDPGYSRTLDRDGDGIGRES